MPVAFVIVTLVLGLFCKSTERYQSKTLREEFKREVGLQMEK